MKTSENQNTVVAKTRNQLYAEIKSLVTEYNNLKFYYDHQGKSDDQCSVLDEVLQDRINQNIKEEMYGKYGVTKTKDEVRLQNLITNNYQPKLENLKINIEKYNTWLSYKLTREYSEELEVTGIKVANANQKVEDMVKLQLHNLTVIVGRLGLTNWSLVQSSYSCSFELGMANVSRPEGFTFEFGRSFDVSLSTSYSSELDNAKMRTNVSTGGSFDIGDDSPTSAFRYYQEMALVLNAINSPIILKSMIGIEKSYSNYRRLAENKAKLEKQANPRINIEG